MDKLYQYALRALGRRPHTAAELRAKLQRRCVDGSDVEEVLDRLRAQSYVDDNQVAEAHSEYRRDQSGLGRRRVLSELLRRGVDEGTAQRAVAEAYRGTDEVQLARRFLRRKLGKPLGHVTVDGRRELGRLFRALARAGFGPTVSSQALAGVSADPELLEAFSDACVPE